MFRRNNILFLLVPLMSQCTVGEILNFKVLFDPIDLKSITEWRMKIFMDSLVYLFSKIVNYKNKINYFANNKNLKIIQVRTY